MVPERDNGLPAGLLPLRREYTEAWRGFDRTEVRQYLDQLEAQVRRLIGDREVAATQIATLSRELESARAEVGKLQSRVDELLKPPERLEDLDERMQRTVQLAHARAEEVTQRAQVAAEKHWASSTEASTKLRERYHRLVEELDKQAEALHSEHESALNQTRAEVQRLTVEAAQRRELLDTEAERKRRKIERDFDTKITSERAAHEKLIADQRTASKNQAERRIAEATAEATRRVEEATAEAKRRLDEATTQAAQRTTAATRKVERLAEIREQARKNLAMADEVLGRSEGLLTALPAEKVIPSAAKLVGGDEPGSPRAKAEPAAVESPTTPAAKPVQPGPSSSPKPAGNDGTPNANGAKENGNVQGASQRQAAGKPQP
ncbi:DivIVA protein [Amycolatopsis sulphurea]|uniref:DivIVA protein n=1 Tax=Amycolatopsis sulphurea TaxID=76022 RepID=A0A2A9FG31_9PSEU|nr:cell division protein DivIVA [Amycolatopsis sulphurea]PFG49385.1 DivIVA protein [Amycolatopsis sulphurea]